MGGYRSFVFEKFRQPMKYFIYIKPVHSNPYYKQTLIQIHSAHDKQIIVTLFVFMHMKIYIHKFVLAAVAYKIFMLFIFYATLRHNSTKQKQQTKRNKVR